MNKPRITDPGHAALRRAARAAIITPSAFAIGEIVVGDSNTAIFCVFGTFGLLAMVDFGGTRRRRLFWYCVLGLIGVATISVGTLCSRQLALAVVTMAVVGFVILLSGVANGYLAAMSVVALLLYVLPVTVQAPPAAVPWRLAGWGIAFVMAVPAALLLWPYFPRDRIRLLAGTTFNAVADLLDALAPAPPDETNAAVAGARLQAAREAFRALQRQWVSTPYRGSGPTRVELALARLVDELNWLIGLAGAPFGSPTAAPPVLFGTLDAPEDRAVMRASAQALRQCGERMHGSRGVPDVQEISDTAAAAAAALGQRLSRLELADDATAQSELTRAWLSSLSPSFRVRGIAYATASVSAEVIKAARATVRPNEADLALERSRWSASLRRTLDLTPLAKRTNLIREHLTPGSVWFRNSVRGAVALAAAVGVEGALSLQHGFWVVLATLSVLRSNASGTGATATRAVAGTVVGFAIGGALMVGLGTAPELLWAILPPVTFLAGFAGTISFAAAQAAFTVLVVVLFNIIEPEGWKVGLVRLEDIVTGCLVSVGVGILFWPHGAGAALAERLAAAYRSAVAYLVVIVRGAVAYGGRTADQIAEDTAQAALGASRRLDEAFGQYLTERGARRFDMDDVAALLVGASRTRLIAHSLAESSDGSEMPRHVAGNIASIVPAGYGELLDRDLTTVQAWYGALADALGAGGAVPPPHGLDPEAHCRALVSVQRTVAADGKAVRPTLTLLLIGQHLDYLARLERHLAAPAQRVARQRVYRWWR